MEDYNLGYRDALDSVSAELKLIIIGMENYMEDEFEIHYETDAKNTLNDLKELLDKCKIADKRLHSKFFGYLTKSKNAKEKWKDD